MSNNFAQTKPFLPHLGVKQILTAGANGAYTAQIDEVPAEKLFVELTSGGATAYVVLPKAKAGLEGREIYITVGSNGYELVTPESSGDTINQVDADGTNQLDVAANTTVRATQVTSTGWIVETIAAATIAVTAPDND